ncbi:MAG: DNA primase [Candidatus Omnitrophota bacterium]|jgi:DNA primase
MGHIPENIIEDILNRVDIVEVISDYIPLKRAGRNFRALCPFHHEKSPSFMVSPDRQIYHCFGCGAGGNVLNFLLQYERLEFLEAVEALAKKAGVAIPQQVRKNSPAAGMVSALHAVNDLAAKFYENNLNSPKGKAAQDYLFARGLSEESLRSFRIGFATDAWDALIAHLRNKNIGLAVLEKAGLILPRDGGGYYDRFRSRIIMPVFDIKSKIIAFGARVMPGVGDKNTAKYVNSPETPLYVKRNCLYGLHLAKDAVRDLDFMIVVEGYLDFIIPYQHGVRNIVASSGTSLTQEQARLIKRYTHNVVVVYDGDSAGQMATLRSLDIFVEEGMQVKVVSLPEGYDPDSFVREKGINAFKALVGQAATLFDYKLAILESRFSSRSIEDKANISSEMLNTIGKFSNSILKSEYLKKLSGALEIDVNSLKDELKKVKSDRPFAEGQPPPVHKNRAVNPTEQLLMKLMLEESSLADRIRRRIEPADFQDERIFRIVTALFDFLDQGREVEPSILINHFADTEISGLICESAFTRDTEPSNKEEIVDDCIRRLKSKKKDSRKRFLHEEIKNAQKSGDEEKLHKLMQEFHSLIKEGAS